MVSVWDQHLAPTYSQSFIIAGALGFFAVTGCRRGISREYATEFEARYAAHVFDEYMRNVPSKQAPLAIIAAMGVI